MKKFLAVLAASAVAVSMFAFTGCGENKDKEPSGAIEGNYEEKTPEEISGILDNFFGGSSDDNTGSGSDSKPEGGNTGSEDNTGDSTSDNANVGLKIDLTGSIYGKDMVDINGSVKGDFKMNVGEEVLKGAGEATVKAYVKTVEVDYSTQKMETVENCNIDVTGKAYIDETYLYAGATGSYALRDSNNKYETKTLGNDTKVKVNMQTLAELLKDFDFSGDDSGNNAVSPLAEEASAFDIAALLKMADEYGIKVGADVSNGMKLKISADANTVWTAMEKLMIEDDGMTKEEAQAQVKVIQGYVTMNKFAVDIYVAFDGNKNLTGASVVMNIDVKINTAAISQGMAEAAMTMPDINVKVFGSVEMYTHNDTVTLPAGIATDTSYTDMTETIVGMIGEMM